MSRPDVLAYRPCGVCARYVSADFGCRHWRPDLSNGKLDPETKAARDARRKREKYWAKKQSLNT